MGAPGARLASTFSSEDEEVKLEAAEPEPLNVSECFRGQREGRTRLTVLPVSQQEVPLSEILQVEAAQDFGSLPQGSTPHCFEVITATMVYYVGEDAIGPHHNPVLAASGVGREVGRSWEKAIRQALMPVTPKASVGAGPRDDHSESPFKWVGDAEDFLLALPPPVGFK